MKWRDTLGWPVELIEGRPILNFVRLLIHTSLWQTWKWRHGLPKSIRHLEGAPHQDGAPVDTTVHKEKP